MRSKVKIPGVRFQLAERRSYGNTLAMLGRLNKIYGQRSLRVMERKDKATELTVSPLLIPMRKKEFPRRKL